LTFPLSSPAYTTPPTLPYFTTSHGSIVSASPYQVPAIFSKGRGKLKLIIDDDDVPLVQLKKLRYGQKDYVTRLLELEAATLSLTQLQHAFPVKGLVHQFLTNPFLGRNLEGKHLHGFPLAPMGFDD
jgi:hypothetical protein